MAGSRRVLLESQNLGHRLNPDPQCDQPHQTNLHHPAKVNPSFIFAQATYWPPVILMLFSRRKWQDLTLLGIMIVGYIANAFIPNWAI